MKFRLTALLLMSLAAATAHAQATPPDPPEVAPLLPAPAAPMATEEFKTPPMTQSFEELDRDKDGALTQNEALRSQEVAMAFERLDDSGDGRLDLAEFAQLRNPLPRR